ncbi:MAG: DsbA family protein [Caldilineaceae bacterium]|nr:DsbA family protein [Caldilineaceae bacterium]HRJ41237.1 thioredoxin domain-containing protein [Caldilineaceae bacterium]
MAERSRTSRPVSAAQTAGKKSPPTGLLLIGGAAILVVLIVIGYVIANQPDPISLSSYNDIPAEWINRNSIGNPEAVIVLQGWEDFLCPACGSWNQTMKPRLMDNYIKTGKIRLEYHHFPLSQHEPGASTAAWAAECAADQGAFWPMHDKLFAGQNSGAAAFSAERMIKYAEELELDSRVFTQCITGQTHFANVRASLNEAMSLGLNSTPSLLINGQLTENPMDYTAVSAEIDRLLAAAGQ